MIINDFLENTKITSKYVLKKSIERLIKKGFLKRLQGKRGKGGYMKFQLPDFVYNNFTLKTVNSIQETSIFNKTTQKTTSLPSSSILNNKETTTTNNEREEKSNIYELPEEWMAINLSEVSETIRFGIQQLKSLYQLEIKKELIESSLEAFAYDMKKDLLPYIKTSPLNFLMGLLRKGMPYSSQDPNYKTAIQIALETYNQKKKQELAYIEKIEENTRKIEYKLWNRGLSREAAIKILGHDKIGSPIAQKGLSAYFNDVEWPKIRLDIPR